MIAVVAVEPSVHERAEQRPEQHAAAGGQQCTGDEHRGQQRRNRQIDQGSQRAGRGYRITNFCPTSIAGHRHQIEHAQQERDEQPESQDMRPPAGYRGWCCRPFTLCSRRSGDWSPTASRPGPKSVRSGQITAGKPLGERTREDVVRALFSKFGTVDMEVRGQRDRAGREHASAAEKHPRIQHVAERSERGEVELAGRTLTHPQRCRGRRAFRPARSAHRPRRSAYRSCASGHRPGNRCVQTDFRDRVPPASWPRCRTRRRGGHRRRRWRSS